MLRRGVVGRLPSLWKRQEELSVSKSLGLLALPENKLEIKEREYMCLYLYIVCLYVI